MRHFDRHHPDMLIPEIAERSPVEQLGFALKINGRMHGVRFRLERFGDDGRPYKIDFDEEFERHKIIRECVYVFSPMLEGEPPKALCYLGIL